MIYLFSCCKYYNFYNICKNQIIRIKILFNIYISLLKRFSNEKVPFYLLINNANQGFGSM